ncbi:hypothetical protein BC830DRAFT_893647 [Chytriomyces sp. MP71]|nr:hypothetical protein BC830DRAFT_893647 [Chytriomyces sp. MP71]
MHSASHSRELVQIQSHIRKTFASHRDQLPSVTDELFEFTLERFIYALSVHPRLPVQAPLSRREIRRILWCSVEALDPLHVASGVLDLCFPAEAGILMPGYVPYGSVSDRKMQRREALRPAWMDAFKVGERDRGGVARAVESREVLRLTNGEERMENEWQEAVCSFSECDEEAEGGEEEVWYDAPYPSFTSIQTLLIARPSTKERTRILSNNGLSATLVSKLTKATINWPHWTIQLLQKELEKCSDPLASLHSVLNNLERHAPSNLSTLVNARHLPKNNFTTNIPNSLFTLLDALTIVTSSSGPNKLAKALKRMLKTGLATHSLFNFPTAASAASTTRHCFTISHEIRIHARGSGARLHHVARMHVPAATRLRCIALLDALQLEGEGEEEWDRERERAVREALYGLACVLPQDGGVREGVDWAVGRCCSVLVRARQEMEEAEGGILGRKLEEEIMGAVSRLVSGKNERILGKVEVSGSDESKEGDEESREMIANVAVYCAIGMAFSSLDVFREERVLNDDVSSTFTSLFMLR